jgi:hypothetical protein
MVLGEPGEGALRADQIGKTTVGWLVRFVEAIREDETRSVVGVPVED